MGDPQDATPTDPTERGADDDRAAHGEPGRNERRRRTGFAPLPHDGLRIDWLTEQGGSESLSLRFENEGWTAEGTVDTGEAGHDFQYVIRLSATWHVQQMLLFRDLDEPDLWLANDGRGRWGEMNGAVRRELGGCEDIDLLVGAFTPTMAVRRLGLGDGESRDVESVTVDTETLAVERIRLRYTRVRHDRWSIERLDTYDDLFDHDSTAGRRKRGAEEFAVDEFGLAIDLPGRFSRRR